MAGEFVLKSGSSGDKQWVDPDKRGHVFATVETEDLRAVEKGGAWNINTGDITLTGATTSATLYMKNTGIINLVINVSVVITSFAANRTGAGDNMLFEIIRNPTAGTLISDANVLTIFNRNFGSEKPIAATIYSASATGKTITDGNVIIQTRGDHNGRLALAIPMVLSQGSSIACRITPPTGNTSMVAQTALVLSQRDSLGPKG